MARYIDADALLSKLPDDLPYKASVKRVLIQAQEADVVPKSEVEKAYLEYEEASGLKQAKDEVAQEIFDEIEREINDALQSNYEVLPQIEESEALWNRVNGKIDALRGMRGFIDELKEKYTEDQSGDT